MLVLQACPRRPPQRLRAIGISLVERTDLSRNAKIWCRVTLSRDSTEPAHGLKDPK